MPRSPKTLLALAAAPFLAGALGVLAGCDDLPRDPEETTERVGGAVLRVGWVAGAEPSPIERAAVAGVAERLDASVEASEGPVHQLVADLQEGKLHLLGGALPEKTPFASEIGLTKPVGIVTLRGEIQPTVMAIRSGENRFLLLVNEAIAKAKR
jgi:hypothetical protein